MELDFLIKQLVRADNQVDHATLQLVEDFFLFGCGLIARDQLNLDRIAREALHRGQVVLTGEHGGGHQNGGLFACKHAFHDCTQGNLGLTEANVTAQQAIHRARGFHIALDFFNAAQLIVGLVVGEGLLELALPDIVVREGEALEASTLSVELDESGGQFLGGCLGTRAGALPVRTAQLVEPYFFRLAAADVLGNEVERGGGDVQKIGAREGDFDEVTRCAVDHHAFHADVPANAVMLMHHEVAGGQVGVALDAVAVGFFGTAGLLACRGVAFGQDGQTQTGIFQTGGQRTLEDVHPAGCGQAIGDGRINAVGFERFAHIFAA